MTKYEWLTTLIALIALLTSILSFFVQNLLFNGKINCKKDIDKNKNTVLIFENNSNKEIVIKEIVVNGTCMVIRSNIDMVKLEYQKFQKDYLKNKGIVLKDNNKIDEELQDYFKNGSGNDEYTELRFKNDFNKKMEEKRINVNNSKKFYVSIVDGYTFYPYKELYGTVITSGSNINFNYFLHENNKDAMRTMKITLKYKVGRGIIRRKKTFYLSPNIC